MKPKEMLLSLMILGFTMDMAACLALKKELASLLNEPGLPAKDLEDTAQDSGCPSKAETEDGQCCVFPFTYRGHQYDYCLSNTKSKGKMWCATTSVWDRSDPKWGNCKDSSCRSKTKTEDGQCCVFPFYIWGKWYYNGCTKDGSKNGKPWCALTSENVYGPLEAGYWGYCKACPEGFETSPSVNVCYRYFNKLATKTEAMDKCAEIDSVLAMPKSKEEMDLFIHVRPKPGYPCWIGMNDTEIEGTFYWDDGSRVDAGWTNWNGGEPNNWGRGEDCVLAYTNGKWNDIKCSKPLLYMCQVSKQK